MSRRRPLAGKVCVSIFDVDSEGISVLVRFCTVWAVDLWQDNMLGFNMPGHVQSVEAGVSTDIAYKSLGFGVPTVVCFNERL